MYHTPLTWCEQENLGYKAHFETFPIVLCFFFPRTLNYKDTVRRSYRPEHAFTIPITERFFSSLSNSVCRHKRNMLLLRNVTCYSLPVASACNVTNQNYILTLNIPRGILWGPQRVIFCDPAVTISNNLLLILVCVPHQLKINIM